MTEPTTSNVGLIVPLTGDLVGTWGSSAMNPNYQVIDAYQAGVLSVSGTSNLTLSSPAGFTPSPSAGPTQSQNALIRLSGTLSSDTTITFPLPGFYIIENLCSGIASFYVQLSSSGGGNSIGAIPGKKCHVFNDGTNMDYVNMPDPGTAYDLHGANVYPPWFSACTTLPYLYKDGSQYSTSAYPNLFAVIGYTFGGSGSNFNVPDERARARIGLDKGNTGRLNVIINASVMGSAGGDQNLQSHTHTITSTDSGHTHSYTGPTGVNGNIAAIAGNNAAATATTGVGTANITSTAATAGVGAGQNVQPSIVSFLPLIKTTILLSFLIPSVCNLLS